MPKNKDLKRRVRARMQKTGESYTTARSHLLKKSERAPAASPNLAELAGYSDKAVTRRTGMDWAEWTDWLDARRATELPHKEIAKLVFEEFEISGWWAQTVTVGYERIKGLREIGQSCSGFYEISKSKTLPVPLAELYAAFDKPRRRNRWLPGGKFEIRKATPGKTMRLNWENDSSVEIYFYAKGEAKAQVSLQHCKLSTKAEADRVRAYWTERLAALAEVLAPN